MKDAPTTPIGMEDILHDPFGVSVTDLQFIPDQLGNDYGLHFFDLGVDTDFDPAGQNTAIRAALVRYCPVSQSSPLPDFYSRPALLFVHGMTDYFFQTHVAEHYHQRGYAVYGLDMRKCGRAWLEGQTWHHVTDQAIYDEDITIAFSAIAAAHTSVVVIGHSTGGLDVTLWARRLHEQAKTGSEPHAALHSRLAGIVGNSPWYGMQFNKPTRFVIERVFPVIARFFPRAPLSGGINPVYGITTHASQQGQWNYNLELKPLLPRKKYISWIVGVVRAQHELHTVPHSTGVPTLILRSDRHHFSTKVDATSFISDVILMPEHMSQYAGNAHPHAHVNIIEGATHDVFLSQEPARSRAFHAMDSWLEDTVAHSDVASEK